jgi:hypothetical protein
MKNVMSTEPTFYKHFQSENVLLQFVREEYPRYEIWSVRDTDTDNLISFLSYDTKRFDYSIEFTNESNEFFVSDTNTENFEKVILQFTNNLLKKTIKTQML